MNLDECLRAELAHVVSVVEAAVPELVRPQGWAARLVRFLAAAVL